MQVKLEDGPHAQCVFGIDHQLNCSYLDTMTSAALIRKVAARS
jgi:hypothetical protein